VRAGARVLVNLSASPFDVRKLDVRAKLAAHAASRFDVGVILCNLVGANDALVFDGASLAVDPGGAVAAAARSFVADDLWLTFDRRVGDRGTFEALDEAAGRRGRSLSEPRLNAATIEPRPCVVELSDAAIDALEAAIVCGLRGWATKLGFRQAVLGLSGGIDSSLVAYLAAEVFGPEQVLAVQLPSAFTSELSTRLADEIVASLGLRSATIAIDPLRAAFASAYADSGLVPLQGVAAENLQSRVRGTLLMGLSNAEGRLLLATGNKSELATGYCTLYGDMNGGIAPLGDLWKLQVFAMCRRINARAGRELLPLAVIERPPTAELAPGQRDDDSLPPYAQLDPVLVGLVEDRLDDATIAAITGADLAVVARMRGLLDRAEFKRQQAPIAPRLSRRAWHGRRMPIVHRFAPASS